MSPTPRRTILVTSALPYANGSLHLGHMVEYVQTDIWVRFQRLRGHDCLYVCAERRARHADHAQGAAGGHHARGAGRARRRRAAARLSPASTSRFDNFHTTHSPENREVTERHLPAAASTRGHIRRETIRQAYDEQAQMFLPDRFVRGTCPRCGAADQYGDSCENCGATYSPADLINPVSVVSGTPPVQRDSEHLFFRLGDFEPMLREWTGCGPPAAGGARQARRVVRAPGCATGTSRATRPTSASRSPASRASTSTSGSTRRSATSAASCSTGRQRGPRLRRATGSPAATPRSTTSSARTSSTSTRCSGRRCCTARATARRPTCSCTAS